MLKRFIGVLFIALTLVSCETIRIPPEQINTVLNNEKALVLFTSKISAPKFRANKYHAYTVWEGANNEQIPSRNKHIQVFGDYILRSAIVNPGTYDLKSITFWPDVMKKNIYQSFIIKDLMQFTLGAGEVVYLGDIMFIYDGMEITYKVTNERFLNIMKYYKKMYPKISDRVQKRLISEKEPR